MKNEGWTWADLAGELWARGIDPDGVDISGVLNAPEPEIAADCLANGRDYSIETGREKA